MPNLSPNEVAITRALLEASKANSQIVQALFLLASKTNASSDERVQAAIAQATEQVNAQIEAIGKLVND